MNAKLPKMPSALEGLKALFGDRATLSRSVCEQHSGLEGHHAGYVPDAVFFARCRDDVSAIAKWCNEHGVPLIAQGAGTSLEGHLAATQGGISLDLAQLNAIRAVNVEDMNCVVEPGVTREMLNRHLRDTGLFFPVDPGANATIGGMAATRASGTNAVRYGTMRDNVLALEVVLADGRIVKTGTSAGKSAAGYDLTGLFVGSEGTLGIITSITLRLHGQPEATIVGTCVFPDLESAVQAVIIGLQAGIPFARIELLDDRQIAACNAFSGLVMAELPTLFLEFHGTRASAAADAETFGTIAKEFGSADMDVADRAEDRTKLWHARHNAYFATKALVPDAQVWSTDVCLPISRLAESILTTRAEIDREGLQATIVGHVGDGNYHVLFPLDPQSSDTFAKVKRVNDKMVDQAIALGGTCTGEHGIGIGKREALVREHGEEAVAVMATVKASLDPNNILNPDKIFLSMIAY